MNWLHYLAEANIYVSVLYLAYCLFLTRNTHYQLSRAYLIIACVVSFLIPLVQVGFLRSAQPLANQHRELSNAYEPPITTQIIDQVPISNVHTASPLKMLPQ